MFSFFEKDLEVKFMKKSFLLLVSILLVFNITSTVLASSETQSFAMYVNPCFDDVQLFSEDIAGVCIGDKWGYITKNGKYLVEPKYDYAAPFSEGKALVGEAYEKMEYGQKVTYYKLGFINTSGKYFPLISGNKEFEIEGRNFLYQWDYINDKEGSPIYHCYINDYLFTERIYEGDFNDSYIFDSDGKQIDQEISFIEPYGDKLYGIYSDGLISGGQLQRGIPYNIYFYDINKEPKLVFPVTYSKYFDNIEEYNSFKENPKEIKYLYSGIYPFHDGYAGAFASVDPKCVFSDYYSLSVSYEAVNEYLFVLLDKTGNVVFDGNYRMVKYIGEKTKQVVNNGRIVLCNTDEKWGATDVNGNVVIPFEYDNMHPYLSKRYAVKKDGVWGYIDDNGECLIDLQYEEATSFNNGIALVKKDDIYYCINENNEKISGSERIAEELYFCSDVVNDPDSMIWIKENDKYGLAKLSKNNIFKIERVLMKDSNNTSLDNIPDTGVFAISVDVTNEKNYDGSASLIIACYDDMGVLNDIQHEKIGQKLSYSFNISSKNVKFIKVFIWSDSTFEPLAETIRIY